ncbi:MAG TPA: polysaccharide biosynthesis protein [Campylobacterales bacterium]|nr:polysaccharide biosynthesis protein [Campylobacterales bacterium]
MYIFIDILFTLVAVYIAFLLRFDFSIPTQYSSDVFKAFVFFSTVRVVLFYYFSLYRVSWRHFGFKDLTRLIYLLILSTSVLLISIYLFRDSFFQGFPRSIVPVEFFIALFLLLAFRVSKRFALEVFNKHALGIPTLIVASMQEAEQISRDLIKSSSIYWPVVIYDEEAKGTKINGIDVMGFKKIKEIYDGLQVAIVSEDQDIKEVYKKLKDLNIKEIKLSRKLQDSKVAIENVSVEDLLSRTPKGLDLKVIESFIKNKTIMITGAGGSIGSELSRQCQKFGAKKLILLDHSEYNLYQIEQELSSNNIIPVMSSVTSLELLEKTFQLYKIDIVIHAAAYKHVPLVEQNIAQAIKNNIIGTKNVIDLAIKYNVKKCLLISTDKAVRPTNVMGTTKRVCELYAQNIDSHDTKVVAVRFGNVLGSSGSVIPRFQAQIDKGKSLTVTHPDITRYFMLIPEACELVLQAASIGEGDELFVLDMGEPIKIVDLAKKMIELSGKDIDIIFTGLRPGEKLYEELLIDESDKSTQYESIFVAKQTKYDIDLLKKQIDELLSCEDKLSKLKEIVPEFNHNIVQ